MGKRKPEQGPDPAYKVAKARAEAKIKQREELAAQIALEMGEWENKQGVFCNSNGSFQIS